MLCLIVIKLVSSYVIELRKSKTIEDTNFITNKHKIGVVIKDFSQVMAFKKC